jgi:hypothetical protein
MLVVNRSTKYIFNLFQAVHSLFTTAIGSQPTFFVTQPKNTVWMGPAHSVLVENYCRCVFLSVLPWNQTSEMEWWWSDGGLYPEQRKVTTKLSGAKKVNSSLPVNTICDNNITRLNFRFLSSSCHISWNITWLRDIKLSVIDSSCNNVLSQRGTLSFILILARIFCVSLRMRSSRLIGPIPQ